MDVYDEILQTPPSSPLPSSPLPSPPLKPKPASSMTLPTPPDCPFVLAPLPGKGIAVLATQAIPANTPLFSEPPLLLLDHISFSASTSSRVLAGFSSLSGTEKAALLSLCSNLSADEPHAETDVVLGVWKANNFCLDDEGTVNGIFALAARLNHACIGGENCKWNWDGEERRMTFCTDRDVVAGEELTHCYRPDWRMGTKNRKEALMEEYGFECRCKTCEEPEEDD